MSQPQRASAQPIIIKPSRTAADSSKGASALSLAVTEPINGKLTNAVGHERTLRPLAPPLIKRINIGEKHTHPRTYTHSSTHTLTHVHIHIYVSTPTYILPYTYSLPPHTHTHIFIDPSLSIYLS